jgi:hypothetical protein
MKSENKNKEIVPSAEPPSSLEVSSQAAGMGSPSAEPPSSLEVSSQAAGMGSPSAEVIIHIRPYTKN